MCIIYITIQLGDICDDRRTKIQMTIISKVQPCDPMLVYYYPKINYWDELQQLTAVLWVAL